MVKTVFNRIAFSSSNIRIYEVQNFSKQMLENGPERD